jgi:glycerate kinase
MVVGVRRVLPGADVVMVPLADGGEGTVEALVAATGGRLVTADVTGPLGETVSATWGVLGDGSTAVIEMAAASGIMLVPADRLDPMAATTRGTGELILEALDAGCRDLIIGLGGSATNDGGAGMAQALGVRLLDGENRDLPPGGAALVRLRNIDVSGLDRRIASCRVRAACDVTNPLCGPQGASHIYGPQKGATDDVCRQLDKALDNYATVLERDLGIDVRHTPGVGASGGLGAGLVAFLGAELARGMDIVAGAVGLAGHLRGASLVLTGEGRLDAQTAFGKTVSGVAERAKASGVPVVALAGELAGDLSALYERGLTSAMSIAPGPVTAADSMDSAAALVTDAAERVVRLFIAGHDMSRRIDRPSEPP